MRIRGFRLIILPFLILYLRLFYLQIVKGDYFYQLSKNNWLRALPLAAPRGKILDRYGRELASNILSFNLEILPNHVKDIDKVFEIVSQQTGIKKEHLKRRYKNSYQAPFYPLSLLSGISREEAIALSEKLQDLAGISIVAKPERFYPHKDIAAHILGYIGQISAYEFARLKPYGYQLPDYLGKDGAEKILDPYLRGMRGGVLLQIDRRGRLRKRLAVKEPSAGLDVYLSIDLDLERYLQQIMEDKIGCALAMDPNTGEILALVSSPSFDPNIFLKGGKELERILNDFRKPLLNRALQAQYQLGSIFKLLIAIAGLESGKLTKDKIFYCEGIFNYGKKSWRCWQDEGHGPQNLHDAIVHSCNIYFYQAALKVGIDKINYYGQLFGFGKATDIALPAEAEGLLPSREWKLAKFGKPWYSGDTINLSIGQGYLLVTPLQVARFISALANGGYLVKPRIFLSVETEPLDKTWSKRLPISKSTMEFIKKAMYDVVNSPTGTGMKARLHGIEICGKTATAQNPKGKPHAWFAGFAPYKNPEIVFVVIVEHGGKGGNIAAEIARGFFAYYFSRKR